MYMRFNSSLTFRAGGILMSAASVVVLWLLMSLVVTAATPIYVRPGGNDVQCNGTDNVDYPGSGGPGLNCAVKTIQHGIDIVDAGGTVLVAPGTYSEQITVTTSLNLTGAGASSTLIQAPATLAADADGKKNIVEARGTLTLTMAGFSIAGPGPAGCGSIDTGIAAMGGAMLKLTSVTVRDIRDNPFSGCQNGEGIRIGTPRYASTPQIGSAIISGVTITGYQKNGIVVAGPSSQATIQNNTITGHGNTSDIAQNGIQVAGGAVATIIGNTVGGNRCDHPSCGPNPMSQDSSAGILLAPAGGSTLVSGNSVTDNDTGIYNNSNGTVTISDNILSGNRYEGIYLDQGNANVHNNVLSGPGNLGAAIISFNGSTADSQGTLTSNSIQGFGTGIYLANQAGTLHNAAMTAHFNQITDNSTLGVNNTTGASVDATNNWWGCNYGPGSAGTDCAATTNPVSGTAVISPWLNLSVSAKPTTIVVGGTSMVTGSLRINSAAVDTSAAGTVRNGITMTFTTTQGILTPAAVATGSGVATTALSSTARGPANVCAKVDGQTSCLTVTTNLVVYLPIILR